jgi:alkylated DNA repair dioxygenase AlkB
MDHLFSADELSFSTPPYSVKRYNLPDSDITLYNGFFSNEESNEYYSELMQSIEWRQDKIKYYGKVHDLPRLTAWYGDTDKGYTYSQIPMNPLPWTETLLKIKKKIEKEGGIEFSSVLLNQYRNGSDSVSWHSDDEKELGSNPIIGSVSFGETRTFQLKHKYEKEKRENILLTHGSFLLMKGITQHYWKHQIPKSNKPLRSRINLTFRVINA